MNTSTPVQGVLKSVHQQSDDLAGQNCQCCNFLPPTFCKDGGAGDHIYHIHAYFRTRTHTVSQKEVEVWILKETNPKIKLMVLLRCWCFLTWFLINFHLIIQMRTWTQLLSEVYYLFTHTLFWFNSMASSTSYTAVILQCNSMKSSTSYTAGILPLSPGRERSHYFQSSWPSPIPPERDTPPPAIPRKLQMHAAISNDCIQITLACFLSHSSWGAARRARSMSSFARSRFPKPGSRVSLGLKASQ
jgi:hypothetical protein